MEIEQELWGMTPEGEAIVRYTLRNEQGGQVQLTNLGAAVTSVAVPDRSGRIGDVALGYRDAMSYMGDGAAMGKSVGRVANRIAEGRMVVEGEEYRLELNSGRNHLHGGTRNFANRLWESRVETNRVVMSLYSPDGDQGYPGNLEVEAVFDFDEENALEITYRAATDRTTPVNLTNHLYVNLDGESSGSVLGHELLIRSAQVPEMDPFQIPTGKMLDVAGSDMDFRSFRRLGDGVGSQFNRIRDFGGYDHPFALEGWQPNILQEAAVLRSPLSGRTMTVLTSQPSLMLYTGNWLAGGCPATKSGGRYENFAGVALECQNFPDAVNRPEFPSPLLRAGEIYCQKTVYRFGTRQETAG